MHILALLLLLSPSAQAGAHFVEKQIELDGSTFQYRVFVPQNWTADRQWPVILFLHGAGERGSDDVYQTQVGLGPVVAARASTFPAVVVMPQCARGRLWNDPVEEAQVIAALDRSLSEFNGDPDRVYLTGLSMGGYGVYYFASRYPERFAALAPICGGIVPPAGVARRNGNAAQTDASKVAGRIGATPIWIFHGAADRRVPVSESRRAVELLKPLNPGLRYTEYPGVGHNSWERAYSEDGFFDWLLAQRKR